MNDMTQVIGLIPQMNDEQLAQMKKSFDLILSAITTEMEKREHSEGTPDA
jgi:hypothetical protein